MMKYKELAPDFGYEFTEKQQKIISEGDANNSDSVITSEYYPNIIKLIKKCTRCTMPYTPNFLRNNEFYAEHYMHFAPEDYIAIIQKFRTSNYRNCIHGANPDYYGNLIFQFSRKGEFFDSKGKSLGKHNLLMEISVRQSLDGESVVALVSLNDKENHMDQ